MARPNPKYPNFRRLGPKLKPSNFPTIQTKTQIKKKIVEINNVNKCKILVYTDIRLECPTLPNGRIVSDRPDTQTVEVIVHMIGNNIDEKIVWRRIRYEYSSCKMQSIAPDEIDMFHSLTDELFNYVIEFADNVEKKQNTLLDRPSGVQYTEDCKHVMDFLI